MPTERVKKIMRSNRSRDTKPEVKLRSLLRAQELIGYRKNWKDLRGKPDVVFTRWKVAIFLNGCFWHGCLRCNRSSSKTNSEFWEVKIERNRERDLSVRQELNSLGWRVVDVWECELKQDPDRVLEIIVKTLVAEGRSMPANLK
ncbi:MAG: very short patch repair endonuclease [Proteobacteria bacterium]|nr:MAG: very short patch repair endonuclease [Pseudomonadota bacterium]